MEEKLIRELDTVALTVDLPAQGLTRGSVGVVVQVYTPADFEVEFVGNDGRTYALSTVKVDQLLRLNFDPTAAA
jgi:hypothetical protein